MMTFICLLLQYISFFFNDTATTEIYTLSLHDALPIFIKNGDMWITARAQPASLADMRWLYPRLPSNGGGPVDVAIKMAGGFEDRKSTRLNSSHANISYAVFCLKKKN